MVVRAFLTSDRRDIRLTKSGGRLDQRVEHRLQVEGRAANDLEHVGGGGLLLERFAQLVEQAGVLDGDDGLAREVPNEIYLLLAERADLMAVHHERADEIALLDDRDVEGRTNPGEVWIKAAEIIVSRLGRRVGHLHRLAAPFHFSEAGSRQRAIDARGDMGIPLGMAIDRYPAQSASLVKREGANIGTAQTRGILDHCVKYRSELARRAGDDPQHLRGRGLPIQRLAQLVEQARVVDGDDGLTREARHQIDLLFGEGANLLPVNADDADHLVLLEHRNGEHGSSAAEFNTRHGNWVAFEVTLMCRRVGGVNRLLRS